MKRCFEFEMLAEEEEWEGWQYIKWCIPTILMKEMILVWSLVDLNRFARLRQYIKWCIQHISKNRKSKMRACSVRRDKTFLKVISSLFLLTTLFLWLFGNILTSFNIFFWFLLFAIFMAFCCFLVLVYLFISVIFFFCLFCILHSLSEFELILDVGLE